MIHTCETLLVASCHPHESLGVPIRSAEKALAIGILSDALKDGSDGRGHLLFPRGRLGCCSVQSGHCGFGYDRPRCCNEEKGLPLRHRVRTER